MDTIIKEIENYKNKIKETEIEKAKLEGKRESILKTLKENYDIDTPENVELKLDELQKEQMKLEESIERKMDKLKEFDW